MPARVTPAEKIRLERALKESFVSAFHVSMLLAAALAVGSALLVAWLIEGKEPEKAEQPKERQPGVVG